MISAGRTVSELMWCPKIDKLGFSKITWNWYYLICCKRKTRSDSFNEQEDKNNSDCVSTVLLKSSKVFPKLKKETYTKMSSQGSAYFNPHTMHEFVEGFVN